MSSPAGAPAWRDIEASPAWQSMQPEQRAAARAKYFDDFMAPTVPEHLDPVELRQRWVSQYQPPEPGLLSKIGGVASDAATLGRDMFKRFQGGELTGAAAVTEGVERAVAPWYKSLEPALNPRVLFEEGYDYEERLSAPFEPSQLTQDLRGAGQYAQAEISPESRAAIANSQITGSLADPRNIQFGADPSLRGIALQGMDVLGQVAPTAAAALATRGMSTRGQLAASGAVGAAQTGGAAGHEEQQRILGMPPEELDRIPEYQELIAEGIDPERARAVLANAAGRGAFTAAAPVGAVGGAFTGAFLSRPGQAVLGRVFGSSPIARAAGGIGLEAAGEGLQEPAEGIAQRYGAAEAIGEDRDVWEGTAGEAAMGLIGGGGPAAIGALLPSGEASAPAAPAIPGDRPRPPLVPSEGVDGEPPRAARPPPATFDEFGNEIPDPLALEGPPREAEPSPIVPVGRPEGVLAPDFVVDTQGTASAPGDYMARAQARASRTGGPGMGPPVEGAPTMSEPDMAQAAFDSAIETLVLETGKKPTERIRSGIAQRVADRFGADPAQLIERNLNPVRAAPASVPEPSAAPASQTAREIPNKPSSLRGGPLTDEQLSIDPAEQPEAFGLPAPMMKRSAKRWPKDFDENHDDVLDFLALHGGLDRDRWKSENVDPANWDSVKAQRKNRRFGAFGPVLMRKGSGLSPGETRELLEQYGFLPPDTGDGTNYDDDAVNMVLDAINREPGEPGTYTMRGQEIQSEIQAIKAQQAEINHEMGTAAALGTDIDAIYDELSRQEAIQELRRERIVTQLDEQTSGAAVSLAGLYQAIMRAGGTDAQITDVELENPTNQRASALHALLRELQEDGASGTDRQAASRDPEAGAQQAAGGQAAAEGAGGRPGAAQETSSETDEVAKLRARVAELEASAGISEVTGLPGKGAFDADESLGWGTVSAIDMDGLGRLNDHVTHEEANKVMRAIGDAMRAATGDGIRFYHLHGDEFAARFEDGAVGASLMAKVQAELAATNVPLAVTLDGGGVREYYYDGIGISFGLGANYATADAATYTSKREREAEGKRQPKLVPGPPQQLRARTPGTERREGDDRRNQGAAVLGVGQGLTDGVSERNAERGTEAVGDQAADQQSARDLVAGEAGSGTPKLDGVLRERRSAQSEGGVPRVDGDLSRRADAKASPLVSQAPDASTSPDQGSLSPIDAAAAQAATSPANNLPEPTDAQKEAGNYVKGHLKLHGLDISIENPAGSSRRPEWPPLKHHYGYIRGTEGRDGEQIDVFLGPKAADAARPVFVVDQVDPKTGKFDEHKVMLGFRTELDARTAYRANYTPDWKGLGKVRRFSIDQFKAWLADGNLRKPASTVKDSLTVQPAAPAAPPKESNREEQGPTVQADQAATGQQANAEAERQAGLLKDEPAPSGNTVFTDEAADAARAKLRELLGRRSTGLDPEILQAGITLAGWHIERGARKFGDFTKAMLADMGDIVRDHLKSWYLAAKFDPRLSAMAGDFSPASEVESADVAAAQEGATDDGQSNVQAGPEGREPEAAPAAGSGRRTGANRVGGRKARDPVDEPDDGLFSEQSILSNQRAGANASGDNAPGKRAGSGNRAAGRGSARPLVANSRDYVITDADALGAGGAISKARGNIEAIRIAKALAQENRPATHEEQQKLVKYVGWGAGELAQNMFPPPGKVVDGTWKELGSTLKAMLTAKEHELAGGSTLNAHYTSPAVIRSMYAALRRFGFEGGTVIEPGMGVGHFRGLMPADMRGTSTYRGIELDPVTALIAAHLYPDSSIQRADFTKAPLPENFFDLAIGNPPFAAFEVRADKKYASMGLSLHDYFFVKSIDSVRPGGLLMFVTSRYTMDKLDDKARAYLAERANLLGAVRLPQTAFKENAGTEVVTDVIFLRKRMEGEKPSSTAWANVAPTTIDGEQVNVNEYFLAHPEMVIGTPSMSGKMRYRNEYTVLPPEGSIEDAFAALVEKLPENVYFGRGDTSHLDAATDFAPKTSKDGGFYTSPTGGLMRNIGGLGKPVQVVGTVAEADKIGSAAMTERNAKIMRAWIPLKEARAKVLAVQLDGGTDTELGSAQLAMGSAYDAFVKQFGPLNLHRSLERTNAKTGKKSVTFIYTNLNAVAGDPDAYAVAALENYNQETGKAARGPMFTKRMLGGPLQFAIDTPDRALAKVLNDTGKADMRLVAELLGMSSEAEAAAALGDLIYQEPGTGRFVTADEYLSGPVRRKLAIARSSNAPARNIDALERVQPKDLEPSQIEVALGVGWVPADVINEFASTVLGIRKSRAVYSAAARQWMMEPVQRAEADSQSYATVKMSASDLLGHALKFKTARVTKTEGSGKDAREVTDVTQTEGANLKISEMRQAWEGWVWADPARATRLAEIYNERYNDNVPRAYDGSHMLFPGQNPVYKLHQHQKRVVWRVVQSGNAYMAHSVGAGKTIAMITAGMEQKRLGLIRKPSFVVPNHMLRQFSREFLDLYPGARLLVADEEQFQGRRRKEFIGRAASEDWDGIVITHSAFGKIPVSAAFSEQFIGGMLDDLRAALDRVDKEDRTTRKTIERQVKSLEQRLERAVNQATKDQGVSFEETGIDFLFVDEAHNFRKLDFSTEMSNLKGVDPTGSLRALDLFTKMRYLDGLRPGRSAVLASGTPVTNTMGEMYNLLRYMAPRALKDAGLDGFDGWAGMFGTTRTQLEKTPSGGYAQVTRFSKFVNVGELIALFRGVADVIRPADLVGKVNVPTVRGGYRQIVTSEKSEAMISFQERLEERIEAIKNRKGPPQKGDDILLSIITDGRFASIDDRFFQLFGKSSPDSKLNTAIRNVFDIWKETKSNAYTDEHGANSMIRGGTQMIFLDLRKRGGGAFDAYEWIRAELMRMGVPADQIAFMQDYKKVAEKKRLFDDMNAGRKRVLIGSTQAMGEGVNAHRRLVALHHVDAPWFPAAVEQREGRIVRQGNQNEEVQILAYASRGTYDATMWQMLENKQRFIDQAMSGDTSLRSMEDLDGSADQFAAAKAIASGDERVVRRAGLEADVLRLGRQRAAHESKQLQLFRDKSDRTTKIAEGNSRIEKSQAALAKVTSTAGDAFSMTIGSKKYAKRADAAGALLAAAEKIYNDPSEDRVFSNAGQLGGIELVGFAPARKGPGAERYHGPTFWLRVPGAHHSEQATVVDVTGAAGAITSMEYFARAGLARKVELDREAVTKAAAELKQIQAELGAPFRYAQDLADKMAELRELERELTGEADKEAAALAAASSGTDTEATPDAGPVDDMDSVPDDDEAADDGAYSLPSSPGAAGVPLADLSRLAAAVHVDGVTVVAVATPAGLPAAAKRDPDHLQAEAWTDGKGQVYLVASNMASLDRARTVLTHEIAGHIGVERVIGDDWDAVAKAIDDLRQGRGPLDQRLRDAIKSAGRRYPDADRATFAKEAIAVMAERGINGSLWDRIVAAVRRWLRASFGRLQWSEAEIRDLLRRGAEAVRKPSRGAGAAVTSSGMLHSKPAGTFYSALNESVSVAKGAPVKGTAKQWKEWLDGAQRRGEFKQSERDWLGVDAWLDGRPETSRAALQDFVRANQVQVQEVMLGDKPSLPPLPEGWTVVEGPAGVLYSDDNPAYRVLDEEGEEVGSGQTEEEAIESAIDPDEAADAPEAFGKPKFAQWQLPGGGKNYRELLITLPSSARSPEADAAQSRLDASNIDDAMRRGAQEQIDRMRQHAIGAAEYRSSHFEQPNILAHVRFNERTDAAGKRVLFVEEVQSDWHQAGRRRGYSTPRSGAGLRIDRESDPGFILIRDAGGAQVGGYSESASNGRTDQQLLDQFVAGQGGDGGVPDAPLKKEWPLTAMKRVIRYAAENGFDRVAWTTGEQQAARYDLSQKIESITVTEQLSGKYHVRALDHGGRLMINENYAGPDLDGVIGKELAGRAIADTAASSKGEAHYSGLDLTVGGEGMKAFYDKMLPNEVGKYIKKWGGKIIGVRIAEAESEPEMVGVDDNGEAIYDNGQQVGGAAQPGIDISPAMRESVLEGQPLFSRPEPPGTDPDSFDENGEPFGPVVKSMRKNARAGQHIDKLFRLPFHVVGALDGRGRLKVGTKVYEAITRVLTESKPDPAGRFAWAGPTIEAIRAGIVDRYGLPEDYLTREDQRKSEIRRALLHAARTANAMEGLTMPESKVLQAMLTGQAVPDGALGELAQPVREAIDQMGREAVELGLITPEAYERNRGAYLHRSYLKYEADRSPLGKMIGNLLDKRRKKLMGDTLRSRGMSMDRATGPLTSALGRVPVKGDIVTILRQRTASGGTATRYQRGPTRDIPPGWSSLGDWTVMAVKLSETKLWRDYTPEEREKMGEILDARYNIIKTFSLMAHDLATGKFLRDLAENPAWVVDELPPGETAAETRGRYATYTDSDWVQVPESVIPGTNSGNGRPVKRWGALAGKYVRAPIWRDLAQLQEMQNPQMWGAWWQSVLREWKTNKTARSPVVHMNNVMSNLVFMDLADVRMRDLVAAIEVFRAGDKDADYRDAMVHGAFGGSFVDQELKRQHLDPILERIIAEAKAEVDTTEGKLRLLSKLFEGIWGTVKRLDRKMVDAYSAEDEIFRLAYYLRRRALGDDADTAARDARRTFLDYDIHAPWVNMARNTVLPFIGYTYRAIPVLSRAISERPWKLAKYATLTAVASWLSYLLAPGDEEEERRVMAPAVQGTTWIGAPRMQRMPWSDADGNPVFLDVRRWIPAGDVFDTGQGEMGFIPAWLQMAGPIQLAGEFALNKQAFTRQPIVDPLTDTATEKAGKVASWAWKSAMPNAPWIPESYSWDKIERALDGGTDQLGREFSVPEALASSVGVKLQGMDVDLQRLYREREFDRIERELKFDLSMRGREYARKTISKAEFDAAVAKHKAKMQALAARRREVLSP